MFKNISSLNWYNGVITLNYCKNKTYFKQESLLEILQNAKMNDSKSMLYLINKYKPLILKYSTSYILKNYEKNYLIQIGSIAVIKETQKYDISHGENYIDCYIINSIKNSYRNLARTQIKYSSESSLNITLDEHDDIESLLKDDYNLENDIIKNIQHLELKNILNSLTDDEFNLIKVSYLTPNLTLYKYCTENNLNYHKKRRQLLSLLSKIKTKLL